jgi:hypothetical protein
VCLEVGERRAFASVIDWPGWSRSGKDEGSALETLAAYAPRYRKAISAAARGLRGRIEPTSFEVVERLRGNATTDFGAPGVASKADERPLDHGEAQRLFRLLRAAWMAFDRAAVATEGAELRTGPRGGGRDLDAIVRHVHDAEGAYLGKIGGPTTAPPDRDDLRTLSLEILEVRAAGGGPPRVPRSGKPWAPRYAVRRSAWHALDHAWEIQDRTGSE